MALLEGSLWATYTLRKLPYAHHPLHLGRPRTLSRSCSKLSCFHFQQAETEASDAEADALEKVEEEEKETPSSPSHLHASSRHARRKWKVRNAQRPTHLNLGPEEDDDRFMQEALCEAQKAATIGEVPVGAVLVSQGRIVARAHNRVEKENDPTAHAEMICIRSTARHLGGWRLLNSTLYVTLEPCPMCAGALLQARVGAVVWGARNPLLGADGSWVSLFPRRSLAETGEEQQITSETNGAAQEKSLVHPFNPDIRVRGGVLASDCSEIMKAFFRKRRKESKEVAAKLFDVSGLLSSIRKAFHVVVSFFNFLGLHRLFGLR